MITTDILQRVVKVKYESSLGTGFTLDIKGKQFLISAKHIFKNLKHENGIEFFRDGEWKRIKVEPIFCENEKIDIIAFSLDGFLTPSHEIFPTMAHMIVSQDVFFLGFPYLLDTDLEAGAELYSAPNDI